MSLRGFPARLGQGRCSSSSAGLTSGLDPRDGKIRGDADPSKGAIDYSCLVCRTTWHVNTFRSDADPSVEQLTGHRRCMSPFLNLIYPTTL